MLNEQKIKKMRKLAAYESGTVSYTHLTYLEKCGEPKTMRTDVQFLEEPQQMEEFMFLGLRKTRGISKKEFRRVFGRDIELVYEKALDKLLLNGMLLEKKDRLYLSKEGVLLSNAVLSEFLFD